MKMLLFMIFVVIPLYSGILDRHDPVKLKTIIKGKEEGLLGIAIVPEGLFGSLAFAISQDKIFVVDTANRRLNIYNKNMEYQSTINHTERNKIGFAEKIFVNDESKILSKINDNGLTITIINDIGMIIFYQTSRNFPKNVKYYFNVFLFNNDLFIYNDNNEIEVLTETGKYETSKNVIEKLKLLTLSEKTASKSFEFLKGIELPENAVQIIERLRNDGKHLIVGDRFYSTRFRQHQAYYEEIKEVREIVRELNINNRMISGNRSPESAVNIDLDKYYLHFVGYDGDHNSYWDAVERIKVNDIKNCAIVVLDKFGETLDAFYYGQLKGYEYDTEIYPTSGAKLAVAPNGDVWFMVSNSEGHTFYKVNRTWGEPSLEAIAINGLEGDSYSKYVMEVLATMDKDQLRILRNTMFAMEGYKFKSKELTMHFNQYEWYKLNDSVQVSASNLSETQQKLIEEIRRLEQE